ncbi:recombination protein NinG [Providencia rettgeri]
MAKAKKPKLKTCKECDKEFTPYLSTQKVCSTSCAILFASKETKKLAEKERKKKESIDRKNLLARKEKLKSQSDWLKEAQAAFNKYIRARDNGKPCISCGCRLIGSDGYLTGSAIDASHYRSRGAASHLSFNVYNVHSSCTRCNRHLSGNAVDYRIRLIKRIGIEKVEALESDNKPRTFTIEYLKRVKRIFAKRARWYEKRRKQFMEAA